MKFKFLTTVVVLSTILVANLKAQSTFDNNNIGAGRFLGFNGPQNLEFRTNNIVRMQSMQSGTSLVNGFTIDRSGFLGLSTDPTFFTSGSATPFSLLHLNGDNPVGIPDFNGYRPWMRYGITFTHNQDLMFIGQRRIADDITNATIAWADNSFGSPNGPDNLTFVYTAGDGTDPSGPTSDGGLEVARMTTQGHTGIGTLWSNTLQPMRTLDVVRNDGAPQFRITRTQSSTATSGRHTDFLTSAAGDLHILSRNFSNNRRVAIGFLDNLTPSERLDVLGTVRLRQMPDNAPDVLITGVEQDATGDYALNYLGFPGGDDVFLSGDGTWVPGSIDCEWNLVNNGGSDDLVMGYGGACNEGRVGIGVDVPDSKLAVKSTLLGGGLNKSIESVATGGTTVFSLKADAFADQSTTNVTGVGADVQGIEEVTFTTGVLGRARDGKYVVGVHGIGANGSVDNGTTVGVAGIAPELSSPGQRIAGVYAENNVAALYHVGPTVGSAQSWTISDENFKQGVTNNVPGIETILQIQPKSYEFMNEEFEFMNLPEGLQYGLLAQDLQAVLPNLVKEASKPEIADPETGEILSPGIEHLAVNYDGLIPVLIKSVQEQQAMIDAQQAQIEALIDMVNACCEGAPGAKNAGDSQGGLYDLQIEGPVLNQNVPNPFREATQITFSLPDAAQVQLQVYNQQGVLVETLAEGSFPAGEYQARWNANHLPTGTYIYVLRVNGQELVKRAVKMN